MSVWVSKCGLFSVVQCESTADYYQALTEFLHWKHLPHFSEEKRAFFSDAVIKSTRAEEKR